ARFWLVTPAPAGGAAGAEPPPQPARAIRPRARSAPARMCILRLREGRPRGSPRERELWTNVTLPPRSTQLRHEFVAAMSDERAWYPGWAWIGAQGRR